MLRKFILFTILFVTIGFSAYFAYVYYVPYSDGIRSGELIKISHKGYVIKTWEGEISQGISGSNIFKFSVLDNNPEVIKKLREYQGKYVKVEYVERLRTFYWWGDTRYFVTSVTLEKSPLFTTK